MNRNQMAKIANSALKMMNNNGNNSSPSTPPGALPTTLDLTDFINALQHYS